MVETMVRKEAVDRRELARARIAAVRESLTNCRLCAHACGVNRFSNPELGRCRAGARARVFSCQTEVSDELELTPTFAVAFSGCDLRCDFCITGAESWNPAAGHLGHPKELAKAAARALQQGARTVMILGGEPTIHLPTVLECVAEFPPCARLIWKTNGHATAQTRQWLEGLFDLWLVDYKFGNDACARKLAHVPNYTATVRENLLWASHHSKLWVRHLLMPGHVDCCWAPVAAWLGEFLPRIPVSLGQAFWPAWRSSAHPELARSLSSEELDQASRIARDSGLSLIR